MRLNYLLLVIAFSLMISQVCSAPRPGGKKEEGGGGGSSEEGKGGEGGEGGEGEEGGEEGGEGGEEGGKEGEEGGGEGGVNEESERKQLVGELIRFESKLDQDIENNDHFDIRYGLVDLETRIIPRMANLSKSIDASLTNQDQKAGEYKFTRGIVDDVTRMLYKAGARACLAADETFYVPEGRCIKYGPYADYDPCVDKIDQILYDGKNNEGICDCVLDERQLVSYQGECYELYTQDACQNDSWLVMANGKPSCEQLPGNCTVDQVYWSPDPVKIPSECHPIGQRGPCSIDQVIVRDLITGQVSCVIPTEGVPVYEPKIKAPELNVESVTEINVETTETNTEVNTDVPIISEPVSVKSVVEVVTGPRVKLNKKEFSIKEATAVLAAEPSPWDRAPCPPGSYRSQTNKCPKTFI